MQVQTCFVPHCTLPPPHCYRLAGGGGFSSLHPIPLLQWLNAKLSPVTTQRLCMCSQKLPILSLCFSTEQHQPASGLQAPRASGPPLPWGARGAIAPPIFAGIEAKTSSLKNIGLLLPPRFSDLPTALALVLRSSSLSQIATEEWRGEYISPRVQ